MAIDPGTDVVASRDVIYKAVVPVDIQAAVDDPSITSAFAQVVTFSSSAPIATDGLTDAQLRASPVDVDTGLVQGLTDTQLRATAVPVSGPLTDTQLRATAVPVTSAGAVASGAADSGNPVKVGGIYSLSKPTFTDGQRGNLQLGTRGSVCAQIMAPDNGNPIPSDSSGGVTGGALCVQPFGPAAVRKTYAAAASGIVNTTTAVTFFAAVASNRTYVTSIQIQAETLGTATELAIRDGASGTVLWRTKIPTTGLPLTNIEFAVPLRGSVNTLMEVVTLTASGTGAVYFNAQGYSSAN